MLTMMLVVCMEFGVNWYCKVHRSSSMHHRRRKEVRRLQKIIAYQQAGTVQLFVVLYYCTVSKKEYGNESSFIPAGRSYGTVP